MKSTGVIRRVDDLGRVVIPKEIRQRMGIGEGTPMEIICTDDGILFKIYRPGVPISKTLSVITEILSDNREELGYEKVNNVMTHIDEIKKILG